MTRAAAAPPPRLRCRELPELPRLAWLAVCDPARGDVLVHHGTGVECRDGWLVEGVWDGEFRLGAFHASDHFFGTGIRVVGGDVYFVPSSALVNRLVYCRHRGHLLASNSLALLLAFTGAELDPQHDYRAETYTMRQGEAAYRKEFAVLHAEIPSFFQVYGECLVMGAGDLIARSTRRVPAVPSYARYRELVAAALQRVAHNAASSDRRMPMRAFATVSSGYDSAAAAVLVKDLGIEACFTSRYSNSHIPWWLSPRAGIDDGGPIAERLGLKTVYLDRGAPPAGDDELYFLAPGCAPTTVPLHSLARHIERGGRPAVLFTGFLGDEVWDVNPWERAYQTAGVVRGDTTALMLTEIRLKSGFVNVAVPSLLARGIRDIAALSAAPEMAPWRRGGDYDRPIPRRILEEAGVPARLFGRRKKAIVRTYSYPMNPALRRAFFADLRARHGRGGGFVRLHDAANAVAFWLYRGYHLARRALARVPPPDTPAVLVGRRFNFSYLLFLWAARTLSGRLGAALRSREVGPETVYRHRAPRRSAGSGALRLERSP
jgi:hypothetical protein